MKCMIHIFFTPFRLQHVSDFNQNEGLKWQKNHERPEFTYIYHLSKKSSLNRFKKFIFLDFVFIFIFLSNSLIAEKK